MKRKIITDIKDIDKCFSEWMRWRALYDRFEIMIDGCETPIVIDGTVAYNGEDFELIDYDAHLGDTGISVDLSDVYRDAEVYSMLEEQCPLELERVLKNAEDEYWEEYEGDREYRNIVNNEYERL